MRDLVVDHGNLHARNVPVPQRFAVHRDRASEHHHGARLRATAKISSSIMTALHLVGCVEKAAWSALPTQPRAPVINTRIAGAKQKGNRHLD
jgi:hypothetical protein